MTSCLLAIPFDAWSHYIAAYAGPSATLRAMATCRVLYQLLNNDDVWQVFLSFRFSSDLATAGVVHAERTLEALCSSNRTDFISGCLLRWVFWGLSHGRLFFRVRPPIFMSETCSCEICAENGFCSNRCVDVRNAASGRIQVNVEATTAASRVGRPTTRPDRRKCTAGTPASLQCHSVFTSWESNEEVFAKWNGNNRVVDHLATGRKLTVFTFGVGGSVGNHLLIGNLDMGDKEFGLVPLLCERLIEVFGSVILSAIGLRETGISDLSISHSERQSGAVSMDLRRKRMEAGTARDCHFGFRNAQENVCKSIQDVYVKLCMFQNHSRIHQGVLSNTFSSIPIIRVRIPTSTGSILFGDLPGHSLHSSIVPKTERYFRKELTTLAQCFQNAAACQPVPIGDSLLTQVFGDAFTGRSHVDIFGVSGPSLESKADLELTLQTMKPWFGWGISTLLWKLVHSSSKPF